MAIKTSHYLRDAVRRDKGIVELFANGVLDIYQGTQPTSAFTSSNAAGATLLARITRNSGAFTPGSPTNGINLYAGIYNVAYVEKDYGENWSGLCVATGTAGWFRLKGNAYDGPDTYGNTVPRIDGSIGITGQDLNFPTGVDFVTGATIVIPGFLLNFTWP